MSPTQTTLVQVLPLAKDLDENKVTPGVLGFVVFAVIGLAVWLLMKSMNKHMNRVDFEEQPTTGGGSAPVGGPDKAGDGGTPGGTSHDAPEATETNEVTGAAGDTGPSAEGKKKSEATVGAAASPAPSSSPTSSSPSSSSSSAKSKG